MSAEAGISENRQQCLMLLSTRTKSCRERKSCMRTFPVHLVSFYIIIYSFSTLTEWCGKSHLSVVTDNFPSTLESLYSTRKRSFLKRTLKRLLQIYTIKTTFLERPLKGIIWRQAVSRPTSVRKLKVPLCRPVSRWGVHRLCCLLVEVQKESQWVSACRGLTDYNRIFN